MHSIEIAQFDHYPSLFNLFCLGCEGIMSQLAKLIDKLPLPRIPKTLKIGREIDRGAWGVVYEGKLDGQPVAVKKIHQLLKDAGGGDDTLTSFFEECEKLKAVDHPHVISECRSSQACRVCMARVNQWHFHHTLTISYFVLDDKLRTTYISRYSAVFAHAACRRPASNFVVSVLTLDYQRTRCLANQLCQENFILIVYPCLNNDVVPPNNATAHETWLGSNGGYIYICQL